MWAPLTTSANGHTGTIYAATDTLRFGVPGANADPRDWDWVRVAVTADTAQRIADALGVLLPTNRIRRTSPTPRPMFASLRIRRGR